MKLEVLQEITIQCPQVLQEVTIPRSGCTQRDDSDQALQAVKFTDKKVLFFVVGARCLSAGRT